MESNNKIDNTFENNTRYVKALERVKQIQGFYWHLFLYLAIVIIVAIIVHGGLEDRFEFFEFVNYIHYDAAYWNVFWFWLPFAIWGFVVLVQGIYVFAIGTSWEERKIRELMDKEDSINY